MVMVAFKVFRGETGQPIGLVSILIAIGSLIAYLLNVSTPLVLLGAGILGIIFLR